MCISQYTISIRCPSVYSYGPTRAVFEIRSIFAFYRLQAFLTLYGMSCLYIFHAGIDDGWHYLGL